MTVSARDRRWAAARAAAVAALLAGASAAALTFARVEFVREKLVRETTTPVEGRVAAPLTSAEARRLTTPFAAVVVVENTSGAPLQITVEADGEPVCRKSVRPGGASRIDCPVRPASGAVPDRIAVTGPATGWNVRALEVASHFGRTTGLGDFYVLPHGTRAALRPSAAVICGFALAACLLWLVPSVRLGRRLRLAHRVIGVAAALVWIAVAASQSAPMVVRFSGQTLAAWIGVLAAPRLWYIAMAARDWTGRRALWLRPVAAAAVATAAVVLAFSTALARPGQDWSTFIHLRHDWFDQHPRLADRADIRRTLRLDEAGGYDGQFMYLMAFDPLLTQLRATPADYWKVADNPPYRFNRPAYPWAIWIVSLGRWSWFPRAMGTLLIAAFGTLSLMIATAAARAGRTPMWGLLPVLIPGLWESLFLFVPEPMAAALLAGAYFAWRARRLPLAAALAAIALLTRDTTAILVLVMTAAEWRTRRSTRGWIWLAAAFVPVLAWRLYVGHLLAPVVGPAAYVTSSPVVGVPFAGMSRMFLDAVAGRDGIEFSGFRPATLVFPFVLTAAIALAAWALAARRHVLTIAAAVYAALASSLNGAVWSHVGNGERTTYELFLCLALLTVAGPAAQLPRPLARALLAFWIAMGVYTFFCSGVSDLAGEGAVAVAWAGAIWLAARAAGPAPVSARTSA